MALTGALHALAHDAEARRAWVAAPGVFAARFALDEAQRAALVSMDRAAFLAIAGFAAIGLASVLGRLSRRESGR